MNESEYATAQRSLFRAVAEGSARATVVPLRSNYVGAARCLTIVARLSADLVSLIDREVIDPLRRVSPHQYWYPREDLHLTIKNVRSARPDRTFSSVEVQSAVRALQGVSLDFDALRFEVCEAARFPTSVVLGAFCSRAHRDMVNVLDQALRAENMFDDKQYASTEVMFGNITICRFVEPPSPQLLRALEQLRQLRLGSHVPTEVVLLECDEVCSAASRQIHTTVANEA